MRLKYGCNPHQSYAAMQPIDPVRAPIRVLNGAPGFINILDALNAWQLVHEAQIATGLPAAASFKHLSPAGVGLAVPVSPALAQAYEVQGKALTPATLAYVRARGTDPKSSFGDFAAISEIVDLATAQFLKGVVCDGIVAPGFEAAALAMLRQKKDGTFIVIEADPAFEPPKRERRELLGMCIEQDRNDHQITASDLANIVCGSLTSEATRDLLLGLVSLKYTQSNSVGYALGGQMIGIGAGQQSRIDCTKLAGGKADLWWLRTHPKVLNLRFKHGVKRQDRSNWRVRYIEGDLTASEEQAFRSALDGSVNPFYADEKDEWLRQLGGVSLVSDGFIPFRDNIDHASRHGVAFVAEPGGALRDNDAQQACREYGMTLIRTEVRCFITKYPCHLHYASYIGYDPACVTCIRQVTDGTR